MNLLLHPHTNVSDPVWSVIFMVFLSCIDQTPDQLLYPAYLHQEHDLPPLL